MCYEFPSFYRHFGSDCPLILKHSGFSAAASSVSLSPWLLMPSDFTCLSNCCRTVGHFYCHSIMAWAVQTDALKPLYVTFSRWVNVIHCQESWNLKPDFSFLIALHWNTPFICSCALWHSMAAVWLSEKRCLGAVTAFKVTEQIQESFQPEMLPRRWPGWEGTDEEGLKCMVVCCFVSMVTELVFVFDVPPVTHLSTSSLWNLNI